MVTKEDLVQRYKELKQKNNKAPKRDEFLLFSGISIINLEQLYGDNPYSKLQEDCGDNPNKLTMERTPMEKIMRQYGNLALELGRLPVASNWTHKKFKPNIGNLRVIHSIKWTEFPQRFKEWIETESIDGYSEILRLIVAQNGEQKIKNDKADKEFEKLIDHIRIWSPLRRRNAEEGYKIELRKHLESKGYSVDEEFGESKFDLLVNNIYMHLKLRKILA